MRRSTSGRTSRRRSAGRLAISRRDRRRDRALVGRARAEHPWDEELEERVELPAWFSTGVLLSATTASALIARAAAHRRVVAFLSACASS
ncbi:MAG: hypothetical protein U0235_32655 [Polyangiaceae bacterium]